MWGSKKAEKKVYSGFPGDCSPEQLIALEKFRVFVNATTKPQDQLKWDDYYLLRFLRARKFILQDTQKMWGAFLQWRYANDINNAMYYKFPELTKLRKDYPHGYHKVDKKFRPIYIQRVGLLNVDEIFKFTTPERLLKYYSMSYQNLINSIFPGCTQHFRKMTGSDGRIQQTCTILDLKDVKLSQAGKAYNFVKPATELSQNNYPQILGNMYVINAPLLFTGIWAMVKMWIDDKTKAKIKIIGSGYKKQLLEIIDPENLPSFIDGGKCNCPGGDCLSRNIGPWNPEGDEVYPYSVGIKDREEELKEKQIQKQLKQKKQILQNQLLKQQVKQEKLQNKQQQVMQEKIENQQRQIKQEVRQNKKQQQQVKEQERQRKQIEIKIDECLVVKNIEGANQLQETKQINVQLTQNLNIKIEVSNTQNDQNDNIIIHLEDVANEANISVQTSQLKKQQQAIFAQGKVPEVVQLKENTNQKANDQQ